MNTNSGTNNNNSSSSSSIYNEIYDVHISWSLIVGVGGVGVMVLSQIYK